jgi:hypothetical protein
LLKCCRWWWRYRWLAKWRCGNYMLPSGNDNSLRFWVYMWSQIWFFFLIEDKLLHVCVRAHASNIICKLLNISWWHETIMCTHVRVRALASSMFCKLLSISGWHETITSCICERAQGFEGNLGCCKNHFLQLCYWTPPTALANSSLAIS